MTIYVFHFGQNHTSKRNFYTIFVEYKDRYIFKLDIKTTEPANTYDVNKYAFDTYLYANRKDLIWVGIKNKNNIFVDFIYNPKNEKQIDYTDKLRTVFSKDYKMDKKTICYFLDKDFNKGG